MRPNSHAFSNERCAHYSLRLIFHSIDCAIKMKRETVQLNYMYNLNCYTFIYIYFSTRMRKRIGFCGRARFILILWRKSVLRWPLFFSSVFLLPLHSFNVSSIWINRCLFSLCILFLTLAAVTQFVRFFFSLDILSGNSPNCFGLRFVWLVRQCRNANSRPFGSSILFGATTNFRRWTVQ